MKLFPEGVITLGDIYRTTKSKPLVALLYLSLGAMVGIIVAHC